MMDFEYDYPRVSLDKPINGITSCGVMKINDGTFDFLDILKRKTISKSLLTPGGFAGMGITEGLTWTMRYFLSFPSTYVIGPVNFGTLTKILKGKLRTKIEDFIWNGYGRLTTLPPGIVRDNVIDALDSDKDLKEILMTSLLKEKIIRVSVYKSPVIINYGDLEKVRDDSGWFKYKPKKESHAKIVITSEWKGQKDLFLDKNTLHAYQKIAITIKNLVHDLKYHLEKNN